MFGKQCMPPCLIHHLTFLASPPTGFAGSFQRRILCLLFNRALRVPYLLEYLGRHSQCSSRTEAGAVLASVPLHASWLHAAWGPGCLIPGCVGDPAASGPAISWVRPSRLGCF